MSLPEMDPDVMSGSRIVRTFRMPRELVHVLGREATQRGLDLTALVLRVLHGYLTYFSLPEAAIAELEADRTALRMDRTQYLAHLLYHRCMALRERGPGFDAPHPPAVPGPAATLEPPPQRGFAGGGAHQASPELLPGTGLWPWGIEQKPTKRQG